jgi:hypothetical protein
MGRVIPYWQAAENRLPELRQDSSGPRPVRNGLNACSAICFAAVRPLPLFSHSAGSPRRTSEFAGCVLGGKMSCVYARVLLPGDAHKLREVRLEALRKDGHLFASSYEIESEFPFENWEWKCTEDSKHCVIGLFDGTDLIGISLVLQYDNDTSGKTGLLGQSYIKSEYRGKGLGNLLYSARMKWILERSSFENAVVYVREGNDVSTALNRKAGAQYLESKEMMCGDGQVALWHWYSFPLDLASRQASKTSAPSWSPGLRLRQALNLWVLWVTRNKSGI